MTARKPSALLSAYNSLCTTQFSAAQSTTSSPVVGRRGTRQHPCRPAGYATIAGDAGEEPERRETSHAWPRPPKGHVHPTPYQIFDLGRNAPYAKAKYYELVKIYHPDKNGSSTGNTEHALRIERYRLVVAAHTILSDPAKRSAYDRFGAGWNGKAEVGHSDAWGQTSHYGSSSRPFNQNWSNTSDNIWKNATWEDWERWREQQDGISQERNQPLYMSNAYFVLVIAALAVMGTVVNYSRAQDAGTYIIEQRDFVHDKASKELRRVRREAGTLNSKEDRIEYFMRQREATLGAGDYESLREDRAQRVLAGKEICHSEDVKER